MNVSNKQRAAALRRNLRLRKQGAGARAVGAPPCPIDPPCPITPPRPIIEDIKGDGTLKNTSKNTL